MKKREVNYIKRIARERGGGKETIKKNKWPGIKKAKKKARGKPMPKLKVGRNILFKNDKAV